MAKAYQGSQRLFLFSLWWMLQVEGRVKVTRKKVSSGISKSTHYMSSYRYN
ncbi:BgTH12-03481 [Blumeria graminis f. sp. triticale]|uniref:Bgt-55102 n=2 Tax=Blumeria graminis TaxID=34373 RepID=A0A9X9PR68_BLUGR|nr:BgTH12-03481 [Blumeria graminis f. sp. triticale]VCU39504.1 Bgt-55102 [Blumeria graminis f. sp. tritici]